MSKKRLQPDKKKTDAKSPAPSRAGIAGTVGSNRFRFAAAFGLSCLGLHALICVLPTSFAKFVCEYTARTLGQVLNVFGLPVAVRGNIVSGAGLAFQIVLECTALFTVGLFACFVCFSQADARKKALALTLGIPALYVGNIIRLTLIFVASRYDPRLFGITHVYLGQVFTIFMVLLACILWLKWVNPAPAPGPLSKAVGFLARFAVICSCVFLFWMGFHRWYVWFLDRLMILGFSFYGYRLLVPPETAIYYETFSIVTFASLTLATSSIKWSKKARALSVVLGLFFLLHLFHRINYALTSVFHSSTLFQLDVFLCDIGQYLLPILLWLVMTLWQYRRVNVRHRAG